MGTDKLVFAVEPCYYHIRKKNAGKSRGMRRTYFRLWPLPVTWLSLPVKRPY